MSNGKQETIEDIAAWLRRPREGENAYLKLWRDEIADRIEAAHNREMAAKDAEIAELRERIKIAEAALKPVLECKVMSAMTAEIAPGRSKYCATIIEEAQHIYNEGEAK